MTAIRDVPVLWSNVDVEQTGPGAATVNAALATATERWASLTILDYNAHFTGHPEWFGPIVGGFRDVHPNDAGQKKLAAWLVGILNDRIPPPTSS